MRLIIVLLTVMMVSVATAENVIVSKVIDGSTFMPSGGTKTRLLGIYAPENDSASTARLCHLVENRVVRLEREDNRTDEYGCGLAYVFLDTIDVGAQMVASGYAMASLDNPCSRTDNYLRLEIAARTAGLGIWAGHFYTAAVDKKMTTDDSTQITEKSEPKEIPRQCAAITKKGTRCKRAAAVGSAYCWQHKK